MKISDKAKKAIILGAICAVAYLSVYIARNVLSTVTPKLTDLGYKESYIGRISSVFFIFYAVGQLLNGIIGDKIKAKYMMCLGLLFAGVTNFTFPYLIDNAIGAMVTYGMTGFFLSMIYAPMTKVVSESTDPLHGTRCAVAYNSASFLGSPITGVLALVLVWDSAFKVSAFILIAMACITFIVFGALEKQNFVKYGNGKKQKQEGNSNGVKALLENQIVKYSFVSILTGIVRTSVVFWLPTYIAKHLNFEPNVATTIYTVSTLLIATNNFIAVFVFEKLKRNLDKTVLVFFIASALTFFLAYVIKMPIINIVVMVLAILTANGASSMMWTEYCLSLRKTGMVSSATGYLDFLSYAAAAIANVIFADAATSIGWGSLILVWCALMVLGVIISLPFKKFKKEKTNVTNV